MGMDMVVVVTMVMMVMLMVVTGDGHGDGGVILCGIFTYYSPLQAYLVDAAMAMGLRIRTSGDSSRARRRWRRTQIRSSDGRR